MNHGGDGRNPGRSWEGNIKMDSRQISCEYEVPIQLIQEYFQTT
jgi:hypothetical protein